MSKSQLIITGFDPAGPFAGLLLPPRFRKRQSETRFKQEWRLTLEQYYTLMREFVGPKRQRGSIQMGAAGAMAAGGSGAPSGSVVLTNHTDSYFGIQPDTGTAGFSFLNNGELRRIVDANPSGEWWSDEPETSIGNSYEVRALSAGKSGTWTNSGAADNIWTTMTATRTWSITSSGFKNTSAVFEVGLDGAESALDSATLTADVTIEP